MLLSPLYFSKVIEPISLLINVHLDIGLVQAMSFCQCWRWWCCCCWCNIIQDPILTAFELSWELRRLAFSEHEFKSEYLVGADVDEAVEDYCWILWLLTQICSNLNCDFATEITNIPLLEWQICWNWIEKYYVHVTETDSILQLKWQILSAKMTNILQSKRQKICN